MWTCQNMSLRNIVWIAFNLGSQQLVAPEWMNEPRFAITMKIPEGVTREQFYHMFQNMLVERFRLKFHRDRKEVHGYELLVAKNGPKFKESVPEPPKEAAVTSPPLTPAQLRPTVAPDGYPVPPPGVVGAAIMNNRASGQWFRVAIQKLVTELDYQTEKPVVDATGLTGKYDLAMRWVPDTTRPDGDGPSLFTALQDQLGLKLEAKKVTIPIVVVDHAEKTPTEN
jgi:uncharacterized protein (TIGR03435 family)